MLNPVASVGLLLCDNRAPYLRPGWVQKKQP